MLDEEEEDKPETLDEIKKKMNSLFSKLDTLTHYHYTPQAAHADVKVIRNLPTISMEEVAPVAMSGKYFFGFFWTILDLIGPHFFHAKIVFNKTFNLLMKRSPYIRIQ